MSGGGGFRFGKYLLQISQSYPRSLSLNSFASGGFFSRTYIAIFLSSYFMY